VWKEEQSEANSPTNDDRTTSNCDDEYRKLIA